MTGSVSSPTYDVFLIGVGGQGIGLLSETILRAADAAGFPVRGCDTHGLAQRGGTVTSHVRVGGRAHSPLIPAGAAAFVVALERHEALRGLNTMLADGGTLVYYDSCWQPLPVRLGRAAAVAGDDIVREAERRRVRVERVSAALPDPRMQNVAVLATLAKQRLLPGIEPSHIERALDDLLQGPMLEKNLDLFRRLSV